MKMIYWVKYGQSEPSYSGRGSRQGVVKETYVVASDFDDCVQQVECNANYGSNTLSRILEVRYIGDAAFEGV